MQLESSEKGLISPVIYTFVLSLPYTPLAVLIGLQPLPLKLLGMLGLIVLLYIMTAEIAKRMFYRFA